MKRIILLLVAITLLAAFNACKKSSEEFQTAPLNDYFPLETGKYVVYSLDSLVYTNFGTSTEVHSYQVKYQIDSAITDNIGRPAFRVFRFIRNTAIAAWVPDNSFMAVNTGTSVEFIENNMRFLKLKQPIRNNFSWKGNSFIDTYSLNSQVKYLDDWDYIYDSVGVQMQLGTYTFDNALVVNERDEIIGNPNDPASYLEINYSQEKYAYGIGLAYRKFFHAEYQPPVPGLDGHYVDGSFGVTMTMIDHN
ncbi:hypothetical protein BH11BAC4_BH11BAC4_22240 [soil metagenome]